MIREIVAAAAIFGVAAPAYALQQPKHSKKDPRIWEFIYDPNDIYKVISAPGAVLMVQMAPDEEIINVKGADAGTIKWGFLDNILTLKFEGCALPEMLFAVSHKVASPEPRPYAFQIETVPQICSKDIPAPSGTPQGNDGAAQQGPAPSLEALPNLRHLAHPDDLVSGAIPYMAKFRYPSEEKAKRDAEALKIARRQQKEQVAQILGAAAAGHGPTTGVVNNHYYGRGDGRPAAVTDDGNSTTIEFPGHTAVPAVTKLGNTQQGCGGKGEEAVSDFAMYGDKMVIPGIAAGWCLRLNGRVYELRNAAYDPAGRSAGTGTISPYVERDIKGASDGK